MVLYPDLRACARDSRATRRVVETLLCCVGKLKTPLPHMAVERIVGHFLVADKHTHMLTAAFVDMAAPAKVGGRRQMWWSH